MANLYFNCIPEASQLNFSVDLTLRKKLKGVLKDSVAKNLATEILANNETFFNILNKENDQEGLGIYAKYIRGIAKIAFLKASAMSADSELSSSEFISSLIGSDVQLEKEILSELELLRVKPEVISEELTKLILDTKEDVGSETDFSSTEFEIGSIKPSPIEEISALSFPEIKILDKNDLDLTSLVSHYFADSLELVDEFKDFFKSTYMNSIIDYNVDSDIHFRTAAEAMEFALEELQTWADTSDLSLNDNIANYLETKQIEGVNQENFALNLRKGYYAQLSLAHLENIASELLPGIDFKAAGFNLENKSKITFSAAMSNTDVYSEMSKFIEEVLLDSQILNVKTSKDLKTIIEYTDKKIKKNDLNLSFYTTSGLDFSDGDLFVEDFKNEINKLPEGEQKNILSTLYYKFFAKESYFVNGEEKYSILGIIENDKNLSKEDAQGLKDIYVSIYSKLSGSVVKESNVMIGNKTTITNHLNADAVAQLINSVRTNLVALSGTTEVLDGNILSKINFVESTSDEIELLLGEKGNQKSIKISLKPEDSKSNKLFIQVKSPLSSFEAAKCLDLLLGSTTLLKDKALKAYIKENLENSYNISNLVANIAWVLKSKANPKSINNLIDLLPAGNDSLRKVIFNESLPSLKDIVFDALDKGYSVNESESSQLIPKLTSAAKVISLDSKQTRINVAGDQVSNTGKVSALLSHKATVRENRKLIKAGLKPVMHRNLYAKEKASYEILDYVVLEGMKNGDKGKAFTGLTEIEQTHVLFSAFVSKCVKSNFKETTLATTNPSDKSNIEIPIIKMLTPNREFMPSRSNGGSLELNENELREELINTFKTYHEDQANNTIELWKSQINALALSGELNNPLLLEKLQLVKNINDLNSFSEEFKIPVSIVEGTDLTDQIHYKSKKGEFSYIVPNQLFIEKHNIWTNYEKALLEVRNMKSEFYKSLRSQGYFVNNEFALDLNYEDNKMLMNRFSSKHKTAALTAYFYHGAVAKHEINNLFGASIYQFKDDEGKSAEYIENTTQELFKDRAVKRKKNYVEGREVVLKEKSKTERLSKEEKEYLDLFESTKQEVKSNKLYSNMFMNQIKRNAPLTSGIERPFLASKSWKGLYLSKTMYSATVKDKKVFVELLGDLQNGLDQESTDAVCFILEPFSEMVNNSVGNNYSSNFEKDAPLKDITISKDYYTNVTTIQKKASFKLSVQMLENGNRVIHNAFRKMLNAVPYEVPVMVNGKECNSAYDVFLSFGGWNDLRTSYSALSEWLGENTEYRNKFIAMLTFQSAEKTGNSNLNDFSVLEDDDKPLRFKEINMMGHGNILKSGHNPDSTDRDHPSELSMLTQLILAMGLEGATQELSSELFNSLEQISTNELNRFNEDVYLRALNVLETEIENPDNIDTIGAEKISTILNLIYKAKLVDISEQEQQELNVYLNEYNSLNQARSNVIKDLTKRALETREMHGPGSTLLNQEKITWGSLQLQNVARTALTTHINELTVRSKFAGGQHVVATAFNMLQVYTTKNGMRMSRKSYNKFAPKDVLITLENKGNYTNMDLVTVNNDIKPVAFGNVASLVGNEDVIIKGVDLSQANTSELSFMKYFKIDETGKQLFFGSEESGTKALFDQLKNSKDEDERKDLEQLVQSTLSSGEWNATLTEFFTPMMHAAAYNLQKGTDIPDIVGDVNLDTEEGLQQGIANSKLFFKNNLLNIINDKVLNKKYTKSEDPKVLVLNLLKTKNGKPNISFKKDENGNIDIDKTIHAIKKSLSHINESLVNDYLSNVKDALNTRKSELTIEEQSDIKSYENTLLSLGNVADNLFNIALFKFTDVQANNFYKVLQFVTGRIPSQGKQSGTAGKTVGFMDDTRNTFYTCVEFTKLTGQDHDNDKLNTVVLAVDEFGAMYEFEKYLDLNGNISLEKQQEVKAKLIEDIKLNNKELTNKELSEKLQKAIKYEHKYLINAIKNYNLFLIKNIFTSPKNAIESQTPISMNSSEKATKKVGTLSSDEGVEGVDEKDSNTTVETYQPWNIAHFTGVTQVTTVGKGVIGISATAMKHYSTTFKAAANDLEQRFTGFRNKFEALPFKGAYAKEYIERYGLQDSYVGENITSTTDIKVFFQDPITGKTSVKVSKRLANLGSINFDRSKDLAIQEIGESIREKYKHLDPESNHYAILLNYELRKHISNSNISDQQAWEYISEILSAATDNAKEFILGRLGADMYTSGIILNTLMLGFDLVTAINLINEPKVQQLIELSKKTSGLTYEKRRLSIKKVFEEYLKSDLTQNNFESKIRDSKKNIKSRKQELDSLLADPINSNKLKDEGYLDIASISYNEASETVFNNDVEAEERLNNEYNEIKKYVPNGMKFERTVRDPNAYINKLITTVRNNDTTIILQSSDADQAVAALSAGVKYGNTVYIVDKSGKVVQSVNGTSIALIRGEKYSIIGNIDKITLDKILNNNKALYTQYVEGSDATNLDAMFTDLVNKVKEDYEESLSFTDKVFDSIVLDGPRQLYQFIIAAEESKKSNAIWGMNQGLETSDWEASSRLFKIAEALKIERKNLPQFIDDITNNPDKVLEKQSLNLKKDLEELDYSFYNNIYTLTQNRHFIGYIKTQLFIEKMDHTNNNIADITNYLSMGVLNNDAQSEEELEDESNGIVGVDQYRFEKSFKSIKEIPYNINLAKTYSSKDLPDNYRTLKINTKEFNYVFDLSTPKGRQDFVYSFPTILNQLRDLHPAINKNKFIKSLIPDTIVDPYSKEEVKVLKTGNLSEMKEHERGTLKLALKQLSNDSNPYEIKALYEALLHYNLILSKGGNDRYSYNSLISQDEGILDIYNKTLNGLTVEEVSKMVSSLGDLKVLLSPDAIPVISTAPSSFKTFNEMVEEIESNEEQEEEGNQVKKKARVNKKNNFYHVPKIKNLPTVYRSKEYLDLVFTSLKDHEGKKRKMLITPKALTKTVIYDFSDTAFGALDRAGWQIGKTVNIDETRKGQVAYPISNSVPQAYAVVVGSKWESILKSELENLNPDMVFDGKRIEKKTIYDKKPTGKNEFSLSNLQSNIADYVNGLNYFTSDEVPTDVSANGEDFITNQIVRYLGQNIRVSVEYLGIQPINDILNNYNAGLSFKEKNSLNYKLKSKNADVEAKPRHLFQVKIKNQPKIVLNNTFLQSFTSGETVQRINSNNAIALVVSEKFRNESNKDIISVGSGDYKRHYKVSNVSTPISLNNYVQQNGGVLEAFKKLGFNRPYDLSKLLGDPKQQYVYLIEPYDTRANFISTRQEINSIGEIAEPALQSLNVIVKDDLNNKFNELKSEFEFETTRTSSAVVDDAELSDLKSSLKKLDFSTNTIEENNNFVRGLVSSDSVVLFTDIINQTVLSKLSGPTRKLHLYITGKNISLDSFKEGLKAVPEDLIKDFSNKSALETTISLLQAHYDKNSASEKDSFKSYSNDFEYRSSIASGKPLFVFNIKHDQWMQYDYNSKELKNVRIPLFDANNILMSGQENMLNSKKSSEIVSSLFKRNNIFRELSDVNITKFSVHGELAIVGVTPDEVINEEIVSFNSETDPINEIDELLESSMHHFDKSTEEDIIVEGKGRTPGFVMNEEEFLLSEFGEADNIKFVKYADGAVKISLKIKDNYYDFVSMSEDLRNSYAGFTGDKVFEKYKVKINDEYFVFNNLHKVNDILAFELRNKLLEEKEVIKAKDEEVKQMFTTVLLPLSKEIRFPKVFTQEQFNRFKGVESYNDFIRWLKSDYYKNLNEIESAKVKELLKLDADYNAKKIEVKEYIADVRTKNSNNLKVQSTTESFSKAVDEIFVVLTDGTDWKRIKNGKSTNELVNKIASKGIALVLDETAPIKDGFYKDTDTFYLSLFEGESIAKNSKLMASLKKLIDSASKEENKNKKFILDFPFESINAKVYGSFTGYDTAVALARAITLMKNNVKWPSNLVISSKLADAVNGMDGFADLSKINKVKPFITVKKINENVYRLDANKIMQYPMTPTSKETLMDTWNKWLGLESNSVGLYNSPEKNSIVKDIYNGDTKTAFKALIKQWAMSNPKRVNNMASKIGRNAIYDNYFTEVFSLAGTLSEIMTEKFVDNSWMELNSQELEGQNISESQRLVAVPKDINFSIGQSGIRTALINNNGEQYLLEIVNDNYPRIGKEFISDELLDELGVDNTQQLPAFSKQDNFVLASVSKVTEKLRNSFVFEPGQINKLIEEKNIVNITDEHKQVFENATHLLPIDYLVNISEKVKDRLNATPYITDVLNSVNDNINTKYTKDSVIAIIGTTLSDRVYTIDAIQNTLADTVGSYGSFVKRGMDVGATFNVGNATGVEAQVAAYILNSGKYVREGVSLVPKTVVRDGEDTIEVLVKTENVYNRFNPNNDAQRGQSISGMLEVETNVSNKTKDLKKVSLKLNENEVLPFQQNVENFSTVLMNNIEVGNIEESEIENINSELIFKDKLFIQSLLKLHILNKNSEELVRVNSINDLNKVFKESPEMQAEYETLSERVFDFFNEGRLNITIRNREILLNYLRNNFADILVNIHPTHLNIFGKDRYAFEYSKDYLNYLRKTNLTQTAFDQLQTGTIEDLYNVLISSGERVFYKKGILEGQIAAKKLQDILSTEEKPIKALSVGSKYLVLDYDRVYGKGDPNEFDTNKATDKITNYDNTAQNALKDKSGFALMFDYLTSRKYLTPDVYDANTVNFSIDDKSLSLTIEEGASKISLDNLTTDFSKEVKSMVYGKIKSLYDGYIFRTKNQTLSEERLGSESGRLSIAGDLIASNHVYSRRSLEGNPWIWFFNQKIRTTPVKLNAFDDSFYIRNYRISTDVNLSQLYEVSKDKLKIRFTPVKLDQEGNFFLMQKNEDTNAYVVEYTGNLAKDSSDKLTVESFENEELFVRVASMNTHSLLNANDALDKSPTYDSKEGSTFSFLYTGENNDSRIEGPFTIQKELRKTIAVKFSASNPEEIDAKYFIAFEDKNLTGKKAIWTPMFEDSSEINLEEDNKNSKDMNDVLPTQEEIDKAKKDCKGE